MDKEKEKKRGILRRITEIMGFGKTERDIEKTPARLNVMELEGCYDRAGNPKKCDKAE